MQRYNIFFPVHKGLRTMLCDTIQLLQTTDFTDAGEAGTAIERVNTVVAVFEGHASKEDHYVFDAIAAYEPSVVAAFEQEHAEDHALGEALQAWLTAFGYAEAASARQTLGEELTQSFIEFAVFNFKHMAKEEQIINPLLWRYYSDEELHGITGKIIGSIPPQEMAVFSRWMVRGVNNPELLHWLGGVKNTAPRPAFEGLLSLAENVLAPERWALVQEGLLEDAMVA